MTIYEHIGRWLAEIRLAKHITQREIAESLRVTTNTVSRWETATYSLSVDQLYALAKYLEVSINEILEGYTDEAGNQ